MNKKVNYRCNDCDEWTCQTKEQLIDHYKKKHPTSPEGLFDAIGEAWNPLLTRLLKNLKNVRHVVYEENQRYNELETKYKQIAKDYTFLLNKLNAMVVLLNAK